MSWNRIEGNWTQFKGEAKRRWGLLNDDEITQIAGNRQLLAGRIQAKYGVAEDEARRQIDEWTRSIETGAENIYGWLMRSTRDQPLATLAGVGLFAFVLGALWKR